MISQKQSVAKRRRSDWHSRQGKDIQQSHYAIFTLLMILFCNIVIQKQQLLTNVESECKGVWLRLNSSKTKAVHINTETGATFKSEENEGIGQAFTQSGGQDFKYSGLGSWRDKERDVANRKALAWRSRRARLGRVWWTRSSNWCYLEPPLRPYYCIVAKPGHLQ